MVDRIMNFTRFLHALIETLNRLNELHSVLVGGWKRILQISLAKNVVLVVTGVQLVWWLLVGRVGADGKRKKVETVVVSTIY